MTDHRTIALVAGVLALLTAATAVGQFLRRHPDRGLDPAAVRTFNSRLRGWWILCTVLAAAFWLGTTATVVLFGLVSFWALREFITLTPTRKGDHRALFWVFFAFTPLHYVLVGAQPLRRLQRLPPGLRDAVRARPGGLRRRLQAVSRADGQDPGGAGGLRLLPLLRAGPARSCRCPAAGDGPRRQLPAAVLPDPARAVRRLHAVCLEPDARPAAGGPGGEFQPHLGGAARQRHQHGACWPPPCGGPPRPFSSGRRPWPASWWR